MRREVAENVKPPRTLFVKFPFGAPLGPADDAETQRGVIRERCRFCFQRQIQERLSIHLELENAELTTILCTGVLSRRTRFTKGRQEILSEQKS